MSTSSSSVNLDRLGTDLHKPLIPEESTLRRLEFFQPSAGPYTHARKMLMVMAGLSLALTSCEASGKQKGLCQGAGCFGIFGRIKDSE